MSMIRKMDDLISRQDAIDAIEKLDIPEDMCVFEILSHIELAIGTLPPAQPTADVREVVHGKWINCICSHCDYEVLPWNQTYYCPNCGARMDGEI